MTKATPISSSTTSPRSRKAQQREPRRSTPSTRTLRRELVAYFARRRAARRRQGAAGFGKDVHSHRGARRARRRRCADRRRRADQQSGRRHLCASCPRPPGSPIRRGSPAAAQQAAQTASRRRVPGSRTEMICPRTRRHRRHDRQVVAHRRRSSLRPSRDRRGMADELGRPHAVRAVSERFLMIGDPGQIPPVVTIDVRRWETSPRAPHEAAPAVVLSEPSLEAASGSSARSPRADGCRTSRSTS